MFVGHYSASFIAKGLEPRASLALLFIAAQFLDFIFFPLVLFNIEALEMHQNATASTHFFLPFMPWSHSLWAGAFWSLIVLILAHRYLKTSKTTAILLALVTGSHWLLDLLVHTPDLAIWRIFSIDSIRLGFGLWNQALTAFGLECGLLIGAGVYYLKRTHAINKVGKYGPFIFLIVLVGIQAVNTFGPHIAMTEVQFSLVGLVTFSVFTIIAGLLDSNRRGGAQSEL
jgi:hypothetical protein